MKRIIAFAAIFTALGIYAIIGSADSMAVGKAKLAAHVLEYNGQSISAQGNASLTMSPSSAPLALGQSRLESLTAQTITIDLVQDKNRKMAMKTAIATGGVVIHAKRADKDTDPSGKPVTIIRDIHATAKTAEMPQTQDVVRLSGDVLVKITEPNVAEPVATISGETVLMSLKDNKIRIEGQGEKLAEFSVTPKEGEKK